MYAFAAVLLDDNNVVAQSADQGNATQRNATPGQKQQTTAHRAVQRSILETDTQSHPPIARWTLVRLRLPCLLFSML